MHKHDAAKWHCRTQVLKFEPGAERDDEKIDAAFRHLISPQKAGAYDLVEIDGNVLLNVGINNGIWPLVCGGVVPAYDEANAEVGVGNSDDPGSPPEAETALSGASSLYKGMDSGYPTYGTAQTAVWQASFEDAEANWAWEEWAITNGTSLLNRKCESLGTKTTGTWVLRVSVTLS